MFEKKVTYEEVVKDYGRKKTFIIAHEAVEGLYCRYKVKDETIPKGLHKYECRGCSIPDIPCFLFDRLYKKVKWWHFFVGTFITEKEIVLSPRGHREIMGNKED